MPAVHKGSVPIFHAAAQVAGIGPAAALERPLWELFRRPFDDESTAWLAAQEVAARGDEFIVRACRVAGEPERGTFSLQFRYMSA